MAKLSSIDKPVTKAELAEFYQQIFPYLGGNKVVDSSPVGTVISYMGATPPAGYLACDGSKLSATAFPLLFDVLKTLPSATRSSWGDADWVTEFNVPNLQGEFLRGTGTNSHANQGSGANVGVHQDATEVSSSFRYENAIIHPIYSMTGNSGVRNQDKINDRAGFINVAGTYAESGGADSGGMYATRPTNTSVLYCIKYTYVTQEVEYSEVERVIGTWIDGKPLYERVITGTTAKTSDNISLTTVPYEDTYTNVMVVKGFLKKSTNQFIPINFPWGLIDSTSTGVATFSQLTNLTIRTVAYYADCPFWVVIQYTKPTDE